MKISHNCKYLAIGKSNGEILIYEFLNLEYFGKNEKMKIYDENYFNLLNEYPIKKFREQKKDIIELCWSYKVKTKI